LSRMHPADKTLCPYFNKSEGAVYVGCKKNACKNQHPNPQYTKHLHFWETNKGRQQLQKAPRKKENCHYLIKWMKQHPCKYRMQCKKVDCPYQHFGSKNITSDFLDYWSVFPHGQDYTEIELKKSSQLQKGV